MNDMMDVKLKFRSTFWLKIMKYSIYSMDKNCKQNRLEFGVFATVFFGVNIFFVSFFLQREMKCFIFFVCLEPTKEANYIDLCEFCVLYLKNNFDFFFLSEQKKLFVFYMKIIIKKNGSAKYQKQQKMFLERIREAY